MARSNVISKRQQYLTDLFINEEQRYQDIWQSAPEKLRAIQLSPLEGKQMYMLLLLHNSRSVLELGTLVGYSTSWLLRALPADGLVVSIEKSPEHFAIAKGNLQMEINDGKLELINADALDYLASCEQKFDAMFIDANKAAYPDYLDYAYKLLHPGGLLIADNVFLWDSVFDENIEADPIRRTAMQQFNMKLADRNLFESTILPTQEGMAIAIKRK